MQIKYGTTIFSATFLALQASISTISATPIGASNDIGAENMNSHVYKRQSTPVSIQTELVDPAFEEFRSCLKETPTDGVSLTANECFDFSFSADFVGSLTRAAKGESTPEANKFQDVVTSIIGVTALCLKKSSPENMDTECLTDFYKVLIETISN